VLGDHALQSHQAGMPRRHDRCLPSADTKV
jgi:hypothetical protein